MKFGTIPWAAPELVVGTQEPSFSSDSFSFGMVMWELATWKVLTHTHTHTLLLHCHFHFILLPFYKRTQIFHLIKNNKH
jgi:serine/threonine protein kinase